MKTVENSAPCQSFKSCRGYTGNIIRLLIIIALGAILAYSSGIASLSFSVVTIAIAALISSGLALVMIGGGFDFSLIGIALLAAAIINSEVTSGASIIVSLAIGCGAAIACGVLNGLLCAHLRLNPYLTTMATGLSYLGIAINLFSATSPSHAFFPSLLPTASAESTITGFPYGLLIIAVIILLLWLLLNKSRWGKYLRATGCNAKAALECGVNITSVTFSSYVIAGLLCGIAGFFLLSKINLHGLELVALSGLSALCAPLVGGCATNGGRGGVISTVLATAITVLILQFPALYNFGDSPEPVVILWAVVVLAAMIINKLCDKQKTL